jgi:bacillithiol biosynthesis cysteine-adding enzyme BshC
VANNQNISFQKTGYFTKIICDYLDKKESLNEFYNNYPDIEGFGKQLKSKSESFSDNNRAVLNTSLLQQYGTMQISNKTSENIKLLKQKNTFTITTGHQLNLFTGPLYFLYKIVSTINLSNQLKVEFPECNFVPIYWMATEDHDFEEIQYFNFKGKKINWNRESKGAVGRLSTDGMSDVLNEFTSLLGVSKNAQELKDLFSKAYIDHNNLTVATRYLANDLFGENGLVIIDGDDRNLKKLFSTYIKNELIDQTSFTEVNKTIDKLSNNYKVQVNPREINLFYLEENLRERIIFENGIFKVNDTDISFTKSEILDEVDNFPEKFSPNVLMRPLYQETVLPNLCYIGGGGELAYWFELKNYFEKVEIPFPILLLRNSVLLITEKQIRKLDKLNISIDDIFIKQNTLIENKVRTISDIKIDFTDQRSQLKKMFIELEELSNCTDKSFLGAVKAQEKKQLNGIENLEKRLLKAQKRKYMEIVNRITILQNELFPNKSLQERQTNFSEFYEGFGNEMIGKIFMALEPLKLEFDIIEI